MNQTQENILNVTVIEPRLKHPTIFKRYEILETGMSLDIHNDHDPKPLYFQMQAELGNTFQWEYLEQGPEWWKVRITKNEGSEADKTIRELSAQDLRKVAVFKKYGIDFCCGGQKTLKQACEEQNIDVQTILHDLQNTDKIIVNNALPYDEWGLDFLIDFIVNTHHAYVKKQLPEIQAYAAKVAEVHGQAQPELHEVHSMVEALAEELFGHLHKEEMILFPRIKHLVQIAQNNEQKQGFPGFLEGPIRVMIMEHESAGALLKEMREITGNYLLPHDACASYSLLFKMLDEFENDLHTHIHLENNILFPKTEKLESEIFQS
jgi:regulator of cell morphogenesis and NO signaling